MQFVCHLFIDESETHVPYSGKLKSATIFYFTQISLITADFLSPK